MTTRTRIGHAILAILGGAATSFFVGPLTLNTWIGLGWRRPVQDWMIAHGAGSFAGHFGLLYIEIPDYTTAFIGGGIIGVVAWKRWWQLSLVYSGTMFAFPYLSMTLEGSISFFLNIKASAVVTALLINSAMIPLGLAGACLTSRRRRKRHVRRELQLCIKCGYDLTGNESGICPECGRQIEQPGYKTDERVDATP